MTEEEIKQKAEYILMYSYEHENWTNCYGHTPRKSNSTEYRKAIKKALKIAEAMHPAIHNYLMNNHA